MPPPWYKHIMHAEAVEVTVKGRKKIFPKVGELANQPNFRVDDSNSMNYNAYGFWRIWFNDTPYRWNNETKQWNNRYGKPIGFAIKVAGAKLPKKKEADKPKPQANPVPASDETAARIAALEAEVARLRATSSQPKEEEEEEDEAEDSSPEPPAAPVSEPAPPSSEQAEEQKEEAPAAASEDEEAEEEVVQDGEPFSDEVDTKKCPGATVTVGRETKTLERAEKDQHGHAHFINDDDNELKWSPFGFWRLWFNGVPYRWQPDKSIWTDRYDSPTKTYISVVSSASGVPEFKTEALGSV